MAIAFSRSLKAMDEFLGQIRQLTSATDVEAKQVRGLRSSLEKQCKVTTADAASMLACLNNCRNISAEARTSLMKAIVEKTSDERMEGGEILNEENSNRKLQDYTGLCSFLSPQVWNLIMQPSRLPCDCLFLICQWSALLGLVHPSEGTMGVLTAIANFKSWGSISVSDAAKHTMLQSYKKQIRALLATCNNQITTRRPRLPALPATFDDLPACFKEHFGNEPFGFDSVFWAKGWCMFVFAFFFRHQQTTSKATCACGYAVAAHGSDNAFENNQLEKQ